MHITGTIRAMKADQIKFELKNQPQLGKQFTQDVHVQVVDFTRAGA
jgi:hypothetical protein